MRWCDLSFLERKRGKGKNLTETSEPTGTQQKQTTLSLKSKVVEVVIVREVARLYMRYFQVRCDDKTNHFFVRSKMITLIFKSASVLQQCLMCNNGWAWSGCRQQPAQYRCTCTCFNSNASIITQTTYRMASIVSRRVHIRTVRIFHSVVITRRYINLTENSDSHKPFLS